MKSLCFGLICLSMLASCGGSDGGSKNKGMDPGKFRGLNTLEADETVIYQSDCMKTKEDGEESYSMARFEIKMINASTATVKMNQVMFSENCEFALLETQIDGEGDFSLNNTLLRTDVDAISMRPLMDEMTSYMNDNSMCGFRNWETMMLKNITHSDCVEGDMNGDIYIDTKNNGANVTIYLCQANAPINNKCDKMDLHKI